MQKALRLLCCVGGAFGGRDPSMTGLKRLLRRVHHLGHREQFGVVMFGLYSRSRRWIEWACRQPEQNLRLLLLIQLLFERTGGPGKRKQFLLSRFIGQKKQVVYLGLV